MNKRLKSISSLLIASGLLAVACNQQKEQQPFSGPVIKVNPVSSTTIKISDVADSVVVVKLQTSDSVVFARIDKLELDSANYYILDKEGIKGIAVFDREGKFIRQIGQQGGGQGKYEVITDFQLKPGKVEVYDQQTGKLISYDLQGNYLAEKAVEKGYLAFASVQDTTGWATSCGGFCGNLMVGIGDKKTSYLSSPFKDYLFGKDKYFYTTNNALYFTDVFDTYIYQVRGGTPHPAYKLDFGAAANINFSKSGPQNQQKAAYGPTIEVMNEKQMLLTFVYHELQYYAFYDRNSGQVRCGDMLSNDINRVPLGQIVYGRDNMFVTNYEVDEQRAKEGLAYIQQMPPADTAGISRLKAMFEAARPLGTTYLVHTFLKS
ncbi:6-bladed beta-propeller [Chitinophaga horti]|uniref:6-bladed beta-propeller n=1 Tax=Chitinophaga horti TaxID=2920382 RepID=A0ABY6J7F4_9BACT|nr:6-bladed beta-propeller [Chitinophaga horti]UYQ95266.1 6-bladed beta-propeller [Chitinophaga horti]